MVSKFTPSLVSIRKYTHTHAHCSLGGGGGADVLCKGFNVDICVSGTLSIYKKLHNWITDALMTYTHVSSA